MWPSSVCRAAPVAASHSRTVLSLDADATVLPSGEKAILLGIHYMCVLLFSFSLV